eukprot:2371790-Prymnesium_polylepis.1
MPCSSASGIENAVPSKEIRSLPDGGTHVALNEIPEESGAPPTISESTANARMTLPMASTPQDVTKSMCGSGRLLVTPIAPCGVHPFQAMNRCFCSPLGSLRLSNGYSIMSELAQSYRCHRLDVSQN